MNVVGDFSWDPKITGAEEIAELSAHRWEPGTDDFAAVPGSEVFTVPTFARLLGAILQTDGAISRINLFTHANKSMISFSGYIEKKTAMRAYVFLNINGPGNKMTAMDTDSMSDLSEPGTPFTAQKPIKGKKSFTIDDIRKKFAPGAIFVLYACHSGQDTVFLKSIAQFFQIKVIGFSKEIEYHPPTQNTSNKFQRAGTKISIGVDSSPVADWRNLINSPEAITVDP